MRQRAAGQPWLPFSVAQVAELFAVSPGRWWLSGGYAIDQFLGFSSRSHGDIDVSVTRADWPAMCKALGPALEIWIARDGYLYEADAAALPADVDNLWARQPGAKPWRLQINLETVCGGVWTYRRDSQITRGFSDLTWSSTELECVQPAVQLLWKAPAPLPKDEQDYRSVLPRLTAVERAWLGAAIRLAHPLSPWALRPDLAPLCR